MTLKSLVTQNPTKRFIAGNGGNSHKNRILGETGADIIIPVPVGITVRNDFGQVLGKNENMQTGCDPTDKDWFHFMEKVT
jgi:GTPase involved in cell partitioning and DNA repair